MTLGTKLFDLPARLESKPAGRAERAVAALRRGFGGLVGLSAVFNLFMLTGSLFMLQVYDRVLTSRSVPTLVALLVLVTGIYVCLAALEIVRLRASTRIADWFGDEIGPAVARLAIGRAAYGNGPQGQASNPMQDFDRLRGFIGSPASIALCDLPWLPLYLAVAFAFHVDLGMLALGGVAVLFGLAALGDRAAQEPVRLANAATAQRARLIDTAMRASETIAGLGMRGAYLRKYAGVDGELRDAGRHASDRMAFFIGISRGVRLLLQSASLALGAYLALQNEITVGMIIAVSIITSRALAPVEQVIGHWRAFVAARQSWLRLRDQVGSARFGRAEDQAAAAQIVTRRRRPVGRRTLVRPRAAQRHQLLAQGRFLARDRRAERRRKIDARARTRRHPAAARGQRPARRRRTVAVAARPARHGMSATCRRMSSCSTARSPRTSPGSPRIPIRTR